MSDHTKTGQISPLTSRAYTGAGEMDRRQPKAVSPAPVGAQAPEKPTLDSTQNYCFTQPANTEIRKMRWQARAVLWRASLLKSVRCCGAHPRVVRTADGEVHQHREVTFRRYSDSGLSVAGVGGLMACGSVWSCPRCSALVAFERASQLARVFDRCRELGGSAYLMTLTLRHCQDDKLNDLWELLSAGWRSAFGTRSWTGAAATSRRARLIGDRERFGVAGLVRVVECTVSRPGKGSGWHLHIHCVVFCPNYLTQGLSEQWREKLKSMSVSTNVDDIWLAREIFFCRVIERWSRGVEKAGGAPVLGAACDMRSIDLCDDEFLSFYLAKSTYHAALEVTAGQPVKQARFDRLAPFELLAELVADGPNFGVRTPRSWSIEEIPTGFGIVDHSTGETQLVSSPGLWRLWHEWEIASRGRRQIMWSRSRTEDSKLSKFWAELLAARGEVSKDEDIARREFYGEFVASIPVKSWTGRLVWRPEEISELVDAASISKKEFHKKCADLDIQL